jgi:uncharacterized protein YjlB
MTATYKVRPVSFVFADDGLVPNNRLPFLLYKSAIVLDHEHPEETIESVFDANGWGAMWRNGIFDYLHYHATVHEVLGVARGRATVRFGGDHGEELEIRKGDVAIPAREHGPSAFVRDRRFQGGRRLSAGAANGDHPPDTGQPPQALQSIPRVALPATDPVYGAGGPLVELWKKRASQQRADQI